MRERAADVTNRLQENLAGVVVIKIFGRERQEAERFEKATDGVLPPADPGHQCPQPLLSLTPGRSAFFSNINMIGVGGWLILTGSRTFTARQAGGVPRLLVAALRAGADAGACQ